MSNEYKENVIDLWGRRLSVIIITVLIGYIATTASGIEVKLSVIEEKVSSLIKKVEQQGQTIAKQGVLLHGQDKRLTKVETEVSLQDKYKPYYFRYKKDEEEEE